MRELVDVSVVGKKIEGQVDLLAQRMGQGDALLQVFQGETRLGSQR
jgi:hypothetical protein